MNFTDVAPLAAVTKSWSYYATSEQSTSGSGADAYDHNAGTAFGCLGHHGGDGSVEVALQLELTWAVPCKIYRVYGNVYLQTYGGNYRDDGNGGWRHYYIQLRINGVWTTINQYDIKDALGSNQWGYESYVRDLTTGWDNVTGARIYSYVHSYSYEGDRQQFGRLYLYEFNVYREAIIEIFRVHRAAGQQKIGCVELNGHKLRMRKGGTTFGLPLVATTDPQASAVRIYDGAAVKSLALAD